MECNDTASSAIAIPGNVPDGASNDYKYDCLCVCTGLGRMGGLFGEFCLPFTLLGNLGGVNED